MGFKFTGVVAGVFIVYTKPIVIGREFTTIVGSVPAAAVWSYLRQYFTKAVEYGNHGGRLACQIGNVPGVMDAVAVGGKEFRII